MKVTALLLLLGMVSATRITSQDNVWGDVMAGIDQDSYNKESPKAYKSVEKKKPAVPKVDQAAIARQKKLEEMEKQQMLA